MQTEDNFDENEMCERISNNEELLILKAKSLKKLDKTYKYLECLEKILKINPNNIEALIELAKYIGSIRI